MFDTDFYIQRLTQSGTPENQAREIIRSIVDSQIDLVSKRDLAEAVTDLKNAIVMLDRTSTLQFKGLYILLFALCGGMIKLVFYP